MGDGAKECTFIFGEQVPWNGLIILLPGDGQDGFEIESVDARAQEQFLDRPAAFVLFLKLLLSARQLFLARQEALDFFLGRHVWLGIASVRAQCSRCTRDMWNCARLRMLGHRRRVVGRKLVAILAQPATVVIVIICGFILTSTSFA